MSVGSKQASKAIGGTMPASDWLTADLRTHTHKRLTTWQATEQAKREEIFRFYLFINLTFIWCCCCSTSAATTSQSVSRHQATMCKQCATSTETVVLALSHSHRRADANRSGIFYFNFFLGRIDKGRERTMTGDERMEKERKKWKKRNRKKRQNEIPNW